MTPRRVQFLVTAFATIPLMLWAVMAIFRQIDLARSPTPPQAAPSHFWLTCAAVFGFSVLCTTGGFIAGERRPAAYATLVATVAALTMLNYGIVIFRYAASAHRAGISIGRMVLPGLPSLLTSSAALAVAVCSGFYLGSLCRLLGKSPNMDEASI